MWTSGRKGSSWIVVQRLHTDIFGGHDGRRLLLNHLLLLLSSFAFLTHFEVVAPLVRRQFTRTRTTYDSYETVALHSCFCDGVDRPARGWVDRQPS